MSSPRTISDSLVLFKRILSLHNYCIKKAMVFNIKHFFLFFLVFVRPCFSLADFNFSNLVELIDQKSLGSIEETLPHLPEELRLNFVLMSSSASSQGADPLSPRVILFGKDAKLIISFNGASEHRGFDKMEIIQFKDDTKEFEFREINFATGEISGKNPRRCLVCHTSKNPRPNWAPYSVWTMKKSVAYGFGDDYLTNSELEEFLSFKAQVSTHPRYQHLLFHSGSNRAPYLASGDFKGDHRFRPNMRFTVHIFKLNMQRITQMMKDSLGDNYPLYRSVMLELFVTRKQTEYSHKTIDDLGGAIERILQLDLFNQEELELIEESNNAFTKSGVIFSLLLKKSKIEPSDIDMNFLSDFELDSESMASYEEALDYRDGQYEAYEGISLQMLKELMDERPVIKDLIPFKKEYDGFVKKVQSFLTRDKTILSKADEISFYHEGAAAKFDLVLPFITEPQNASNSAGLCSELL